MIELSLMDMVIATMGVLITMALLSCLCCVCMKLSDLKMKSYLVQLAKQKGVKLDVNNIDPKINCQSTQANENCTIVIPDVGIIF